MRSDKHRMTYRHVVTGIAGALLACSPAPDIATVTLVSGNLMLAGDTLELTAHDSLPSRRSENGICLLADSSYSLADDWSLRTSAGQGGHLYAAAVLADRTVVPLDTKAWTGEYCLTRPDSIPQGVNAVRIWSTGPIHVRRVTWVSHWGK